MFSPLNSNAALVYGLQTIWGDAGNRNPRKPSPTISIGFKQPIHHSSSASNIPSIPQFSIEHSRGRTKFIPIIGQLDLVPLSATGKQALPYPYWLKIFEEQRYERSNYGAANQKLNM